MNDIEGLKSSRDSVLRMFLSCFYVDKFGRLDIAWDRYIPFAGLYSQLTTVTDASGNQSQLILDQIRMLMIFSTIVGLIDNSIESVVDSRGYLVIENINLDKNSSVPSHIRDSYGFFAQYQSVNETSLRESWRHSLQSKQRVLLTELYPSLMYEMTAISDIITRLIINIGVIKFD